MSRGNRHVGWIAQRAVVALLLTLPIAARADLAPCEVSPFIEPAEPYVGQQVIYRLQVSRRADARELHWGRAPSFPGMRVEALPTQTDSQPVWRGGYRYSVFEERRALFPVRPGALDIPSASLVCIVSSEGGEAEFVAEVGPARLSVRALPAEGRPDGFGGVVGRVTVHTEAEPRSVELGGSVRFTVRVEGEANLWRLTAPLVELPPPRADLLARPPETARDAGRRLRLRRYFSYDVVPRSPGSLELPGIEVPYFDPSRGRYALARGDAVPIEVLPAAPSEPALEEPDGIGAPTRDVGDASGTLHPILLLVGAGLLGVGLLVFRRARRRRDPWREVDAALRDGALRGVGSDRAGSAQALARALRLALQQYFPGARARSTQELVAAAAGDPALRAAATLLAELDPARFAPGEQPAPDAERVRDAIEGLRHRRPGA